VFDPKPEHDGESQYAERPECCAGGDKCGSLLAASFASEAGPPLTADFMFPDEPGAAPEDPWLCAEETAH
jgi:hypothetical protein